MVAWNLCKVFATVRFCYPPPNKGCVQQILYIQLLIETVKKHPVKTRIGNRIGIGTGLKNQVL